MAQVFISYSRKDLSFVEKLAKDLKGAGFDVWYDLSGITGGARWRVEIESALRNSRFVLVVLSPDSIASEWVDREFLFASNLKRKIIPLLYRPCEMPLNYLDLNYVNVQGDRYRHGFNELLHALHHSLGIDPPKVDEATGYAAGQSELDILASQAIRQELQGDFWNALHTYYKIKRIDSHFPRVDIKIAELEKEVQLRKALSQVKSPQRPMSIVRLLTLLAVIFSAGLLSLYTVFLSPAGNPLDTLTPFASETPVAVVIGTETLFPRTATSTATVTPTHPAAPVLGGADKVAFVANKEIWIMNVDGSELKQVTYDGAFKSDLQWLPDGETIVFISGLTVKYYNITNGRLDILATFPSEISLNAFQVSHDGRQVMLVMSGEIFVVPFGLETMRNFTNRNQVLTMEGSCILPTQGTPASLRVREARWSVDDQLVAWLYKDHLPGNLAVQADQVGVFDIGACTPASISLKDNFPGTHFIPTGYTDASAYELPDFDWDGGDRFVFNTSVRNGGWGYVYIYNWKTHKPTPLFPDQCCFRDARWSPDGSYILYEFQDQRQGTNAQTELYYVLAGELNSDTNFAPIPLPSGFFKDPREAAQPALRPAQ